MPIAKCQIISLVKDKESGEYVIHTYEDIETKYYPITKAPNSGAGIWVCSIEVYQKLGITECVRRLRDAMVAANQKRINALMYTNLKLNNLKL